ncbi:MAG: hypothetical protein JW775_10355 [Candidatus Aminicenantes bacterium]|nr:hypothetical protein [Candidatus Aminicenantes bacterium]
MARRLGRLAEAADIVVEAGSRAARARGAYESSLMGCREVQERLAGLICGAEVVRYGSARLDGLLEQGARDRAGRECAGLAARARALRADLAAVARALLGEAWVEANLPADDFPRPDERKNR